MKKKILFIAPYPFDSAPSQRLKYEQYYPYMREAGFDIRTSSFIDKNFYKIIYKHGFVFQKIFYTVKGYLRRLKDLFRLRQFDIVYIHLWVTPLGKPCFEWLYCMVAKKIVYDIDDMIFLSHSSAANKKSEFLKGKSKPFVLMKNADHVIIGTDLLNKIVSEHNPNRTQVFATVNTDSYKEKLNYSFKGKPVIGWSGSVTTSKYVRIIEDVLKELSCEKEFVLRIIGDADFKMKGVIVDAIPWKAETEVEDLSQIDIGLYPLPDEEWVHGKAGGKALQYMALGIPTLATAIGANFSIIQNGVNGFLIQHHSEWKKYILQLLESETLRKNIGMQGRKTCVKKFSHQANKHLYIDALNKVLNK